ncbi:MAG: AAA family ATPase [Actinomycetota bacterium]
MIAHVRRRGSSLLLAMAAGAALVLPVGEARAGDAAWAEAVLAVAAPLLVVAVLLNLLAVVWSMRRELDAADGTNRAGLVPLTTFDDLIGLDAVADRLREPLRRLRDPGADGRLVGSHRVLVVGPAGSGTTALARAAAGEARAAFLPLRCAELAPRRHTEQVAALRAVFDEARAQLPAVVFLHEVHALADDPTLEQSSRSGASARSRALRQLVTELDATAREPRLLVIASTSRPELLPPAVSADGRLDDRIVLEPPNRAARTDLLRFHASEIPLADDVDLADVASRLPGCIGTDLRAVADAATALARRDGRAEIVQRDLDVAVDRVLQGTDAAHRLLSRDDKERLAFHQAGHALVGHLLPGTAPIERVTILGRQHGPSDPLVFVPHTEPEHVLSRAEMVDGIVALLAGRAAEIQVFGDCSTMAEHDIARATELARAMVTRFGMDDRLGPIRLVETRHGSEFVEERVAQLLSRAERDALDLLGTHATTMQHLALALLVHETIDRRGFRSIVGELPAWGPTIDLRSPEGADDGGHGGLDPIDRSPTRFSP